MRTNQIKIVIIIICIVFYGMSDAQNNASKENTNSSVELRKADIAYHDFKFAIAAEYYETYLKKNTLFEPGILANLADCYWQMRAYDNALQVYQILYQNGNQKASQQERQRIAELYARQGEYSLASSWLKDVVGYQQKANHYDEDSSIKEMKKDSLNWSLNLVNINTDYRDFSPFIANNTLFFSSNKPVKSAKKSNGWDGDNFTHLWEIPLSSVDTLSISQISKNTILHHSLKKKKRLADIYELGDNQTMNQATRILINEPSVAADLNAIGKQIKGLDKFRFNAGAISIDKQNDFYFSANYPEADEEGVNRIFILKGVYAANKIKKIQPLPFGDAEAYSVMHPAINQEGTRLVCSSDKPNGKGKYDLYYSQRTDRTEVWDTLKAFGSNINTPGNEVFPNITPNGYLYFSSDNTPGLGGLDIFRIPIQDAMEGKGDVEHLSYPINSSADDFGWTQSDSTGLEGFITSDRLNNHDNLYRFTYNPIVIAKTPKKSFLEGFVMEKQSQKPVKGTTVFLYNINEDSVYVAKSDINGKYRFPVRTSSDVKIKAVDKNYLNDCFSIHVIYDPQPKDTIQKVPRYLFLDKFKVGFVWKLSNIHYDFNKWNIRPDAMPILDSLIMILNEHSITVELGSHTDSRGSIQYNERLSQNRAESAVAYLIKHGIDSKRITAKGYGESRLLNRCSDGIDCNDDDHQANRRTEVKVTGYTTLQKVQEHINPDIFRDGERLYIKQLPKGFFDDCK